MILDLEDRFLGCLLGVAVGDALGMPVEGYTAEEIRSRFGAVQEMMPAPEGHFHTGLLAGQFTDDTEETLILAESMVEAHGLSPERFAERLMAWGASWTLDERLNRGVGFTTRSAVERMISGVPWTRSGLAIPTCGSAMRAAPVGLLYSFDLDMVSRYADLQSLPTHTDPSSRAGAIAVAVGTALSSQGFPKETVLRVAAGQASRISQEIARRLLQADQLRGSDPEVALERIGTSPLVEETVPAAFYCFLALDPEEGLVTAASSGGDTDSIASIAGALFGSALGTSWIPERWLQPLEGRERIRQLAGRLAELHRALRAW